MLSDYIYAVLPCDCCGLFQLWMNRRLRSGSSRLLAELLAVGLVKCQSALTVELAVKPAACVARAASKLKCALP